MEEMVGNEVEKTRDRMYGSEAQRSKQHGDTSLYSFKNTTKEGGLSDEFDQEIRKFAREII